MPGVSSARAIAVNDGGSTGRPASYYGVRHGDPVNPFKAAGSAVNAIKGAVASVLPGYSPSSSWSSSSLSGSRSSSVPIVASSAPAVASGSVEGNNQFGDIQAYLDRLQGISEANTAQSIALAERQNAWQVQQNQKAMYFNAAEAAKNREWQEMMSNTAHQREVRDLVAAGLNPVLSATGGNGAAVGTGATASGVTSSGTKGEVDPAFAQSLVHLIGTIYSSQAQLQASAINARAVVAAAGAAAGANVYSADRHYDSSIYGYSHINLNQLLNNILGGAARIASASIMAP